MQGESEVQTPLSDALLVANTLKSTVHNDYQLITYPGLGHGLGKQGLRPTVGPMEQKPIDDMVLWLKSRF